MYTYTYVCTQLNVYVMYDCFFFSMGSRIAILMGS